MDLGSGRRWEVLSVLLFALLALAESWHQSEANAMRLAPDIYSEGPLKVKLFTVDSAANSGRRYKRSRLRTGGDVKLHPVPPRPLLIAAPLDAGLYPVVLFQHGYALRNSYYSQMLEHIASHGFIVVAPQMYLFSGSDATEDIETAGLVIDWLAIGLAEALSKRVPLVQPELSKLAAVGHSRGGKVVFGIATGLCNSSLKLSAVIGLDPVDGMGVGQQTKPPILHFSRFSLNLGIPTLIVGAAQGSVKKNFLFPPCAPEGVSHRAFFFDSAAPAFHFVATDYGHMDYMDDRCSGPQGLVSYCLCKNGPAREPMRRFSSGISVAFLQAALLKDSSQLSAAILNPSLAPVNLESPESVGNASDAVKLLSSVK